MKPLTPRQVAIIKAVVEEYSSTAEPVGSDTIDKKFNLGVSPATIRNEMMRLEDYGYLKQPHTSAGRVPTPAAIKLYVTELMKEQELPVAEEVAVKARIWDVRDKLDKLLGEATRILSEKTHYLSVAVTDDGDLYHAGYANILSMPEFFDIDVTRTVLTMIENQHDLLEMFHKANPEEPLHILVGDDLGSEYLYSCGVAFVDFEAGPAHGSIGVIGPARLNYSYAIPMLRHVSGLIKEIGDSWTK